METLIFSQGIKRSYEYYRNIFYSDNALRTSCYNCNFSNLNRVGDITIGDFRGIEKTDFENENGKGVSIVLLNTDKGKYLWKQIESQTVNQSFPIEVGIQKNLKKSTDKPETVEHFWKQYFDNGFKNIMVNYGGFTLKTRSTIYINQLKKDVKSKIKKIIRYKK